MNAEKYFFIKTNRIFSSFKKFSWILVPTIAFGGLYYPKLGLLLIPIMVALLTLGFLKGKYWCGNLCPHGSLFDSLILQISPNRRIGQALKATPIKVIFFIFYMTMFAMRLIKVSSFWGSMVYVDKLGFVFAVNYLVPTTIGIILAIFNNPRAWCSFCPMGTMEQVAYKLGKITGWNKKTDRMVSVAASEMCHKCAKCARVCPMQLQPYQEFTTNNQFENENCIRCGTCVVNCPAGILCLANKEENEEIRSETKLIGYEERQRIHAVVERITSLAPDVQEYIFRFKTPEVISYEPGQFILIKINAQPEMFRAYSISHYDISGRSVGITIKKMEQGYGTTILFDLLKEGEEIELEGPLGRELVIAEDVSKVLLVAGGIGITPFVPIVEDLIFRKSQVKEIKLIYGVNKEEEFLYREHFESLSKDYGKFQFIPVVAKPQESWTKEKGFVTDVMSQLDLAGYKVYMCGPKPMTTASLRVLQQRGVTQQDIFAESA